MTVRGEGFSGTGERVVCLFGRGEVEATALSDTTLLAYAPRAVDGVGRVRVQVGLSDGAGRASSGPVYEYRMEARIERLMPSSGPVNGGTLVSVIGVGLSSEKHSCMFGGVNGTALARFVSDSLLLCRTPSAGLARVAGSSLEVEVGTSGSGGMGASSIFRYSLAMRASGLWPSQGPELGGQPVTIVGEGFVNSGMLVCRFGEVVVKGASLSSTSVVCTAPPSHMGNVTVEVSNNGGADFEGARMLFESRSPMRAVTVVPSQGPVEGGTVVLVSGTIGERASALDFVFEQHV